MRDTSFAKRKFSVIKGSHPDQTDRAVTPITRPIRSQEIMRHQPFWTALAAEGLDKQRRRMLQAGLLVLRYLDIYFEEGRDGAHAAMHMTAFRRRLLVCGDNAFGRLLTSIVDVIDRPKTAYDVLWGPLAAYARLLEDFREFALAYDVWDTIIRGMMRVGVLDAQTSQEIVVLAFLHRASTSYRLGRADDALADYARVFEYSEKHGLEKAAVTASIGACTPLATTGAHSVALQTLDIQIVKAEGNGWDELYAYAATTRGHVRALLKRHQEALLDFSLAIHSKAMLRDYDSLVMNIAACSAECGYFSLAKDAHELTLKNARNMAAKMSAAINLIELAMWTNNRTNFDRFSEVAMTLPADAKAQVYRSLYIARGRIFFELTDEPLAEITRTLEMATALNFTPAVEQINQDIRRFNMGGSLVPAAPKTAPLPLAMRLLHKHVRARLREAVA